MFSKRVNFSRCYSFHFPIKELKNKNKQKSLKNGALKKIIRYYTFKNRYAL